MAVEPSAVDGIGYDDNTITNPNPGWMAGKKFKMLGQNSTSSSVAAANQQIGAVALPAIAANTVGTVVVANSLVTTGSYVFPAGANEAAGVYAGDTTAGRGMDVWVESVGNGTFTLGYNPRAAMSAAWTAYFLIIN